MNTTSETKHSIFTLTKKVQTRKGNIVLTHENGVYELPKVGDRGDVSRLDNWRSLLTPGRRIQIYERDGEPLVAALMINDDDLLVWDSLPMFDMPLVPFWTKMYKEILEEDGQDSN